MQLAHRQGTPLGYAMDLLQEEELDAGEVKARREHMRVFEMFTFSESFPRTGGWLRAVKGGGTPVRLRRRASARTSVPVSPSFFLSHMHAYSSPLSRSLDLSPSLSSSSFFLCIFVYLISLSSIVQVHIFLAVFLPLPLSVSLPPWSQTPSSRCTALTSASPLAVRSRGCLVITEATMSGRKWKQPILHSLHKEYGEMDRGQEGIAEFAVKHKLFAEIHDSVPTGHTVGHRL